jgi:hypothetical protein
MTSPKETYRKSCRFQGGVFDPPRLQQQSQTRYRCPNTLTPCESPEGCSPALKRSLLRQNRSNLIPVQESVYHLSLSGRAALRNTHTHTHTHTYTHIPTRAYNNHVSVQEFVMCAGVCISVCGCVCFSRTCLVVNCV